MTLRRRLALWYGLIYAVLLLLVIAFSYGVHARGQYDDLDRALITTTGHQADMAASGDVQLMEGGDGFQVFLRRYTASGQLQSASDDDQLPTVDPRTILAHPSAVAYPWLAALMPTMKSPSVATDGAFGIFNATDGRWRVYVQPLMQNGHVVGYLEGLTSLDQVDDGLSDMLRLLALVGVAGLLIELAGSYFVVRGALCTVDRLTHAAQAIAQSRDLTQRIESTRRDDEIGRLATTLNDMLKSLQTSVVTQQRFVSDASHELRAPLTALQANLDLVCRYPDLAPAAREEALGEAERESARLARLVADLLALARADAGVALRRQTVELDALVLDGFQTARTLAQGQRLVLDPFEPVTIMGDEDRLKQLFLILVDNALKYTAIDGQVTVGLRQVGTEYSEIVIRDTGIGIPADALPHVFERFYRADPARSRDPGGTGLGLSIARWISEQHGGTVMLTSTVGKGTVATVRLPLSGPSSRVADARAGMPLAQHAGCSPLTVHRA